MPFFEVSAETVALPAIRNTYPRANKAARSNRESVASFVLQPEDYGVPRAAYDARRDG